MILLCAGLVQNLLCADAGTSTQIDLIDAVSKIEAAIIHNTRPALYVDIMLI